MRSVEKLPKVSTSIPHAVTLHAGLTATLIVAYVVPSASWSSNKSNNEKELVATLKKYVTDHKIKYKALAEVEIVDAIPKTPSGKLLRKDRKSLGS